VDGRFGHGRWRGYGVAMTVERTDGLETPRGGAYTLTVYTDADGAEVDRSVAVLALVSEYSADDRWLGETVLRLSPAG
jgi:hypothetical protein